MPQTLPFVINPPFTLGEMANDVVQHLEFAPDWFGFTTPPVGNVLLTRFFSQLVLVQFPSELLANADGGSWGWSNGALPVGFRPLTVSFSSPLFISDGGDFKLAILTPDDDGRVELNTVEANIATGIIGPGSVVGGVQSGFIQTTTCYYSLAT